MREAQRVSDHEAANVIDLVEAQVALAPEATAALHRGEPTSYLELNSQANRIAHQLRRLGVSADVPVGVCVPRSAEMLACLLGILKAGGAYVPLDPDYPTKRLRSMIEDAEPHVVLTRDGLRDRLPVIRRRILSLDGDAAAIDAELDTDPQSLAGPDDLAYIIFTSGSTGRPKGVAMPHRALCNLLRWQRTALDPAPKRTLQFASISFDVAFQDIFGTLSTGGTVMLIDDEQRRDFDWLARFVDEQAIERLFLPPLALEALAQRLSGTPSDTRAEVITAGERLEITPSIRTLFARRPNWRLHNHYGPAETHVVTAHTLEGDPERWPEMPPIGQPIANVSIHILDQTGAPVPQGQPGEIHIGGVALARGYAKQPELTAERFPRDVLATGDRMYRTGDLARWREDGAIDFLGRADDQVKIRGYRIEPGEIVGALVQHRAVSQAAVIAERHATQGRRLVAYVVPAPGRQPSGSELRELLTATLPEYMVPSAFVTLDELPLTPNGKLDRKALPPADVPIETATDVLASPLEQRIAAIWSELLGVPQIGPSDNFFALGGHSLLAGDVISRCSKALDVALPLRAIFASPTVRELAQAVETARRQGNAEQRIPRARRRRVSEVVGDAS